MGVLPGVQVFLLGPGDIGVEVCAEPPLGEAAGGVVRQVGAPQGGRGLPPRRGCQQHRLVVSPEVSHQK